MFGFTQSFNISAAAIAWRLEHLGKVADLSLEETVELRERFFRLSVKQRKRVYGPDGGA